MSVLMLVIITTTNVARTKLKKKYANHYLYTHGGPRMGFQCSSGLKFGNVRRGKNQSFHRKTSQSRVHVEKQQQTQPWVRESIPESICGR